MSIIRFDELKKKWREIGKKAINNDPTFEIEINKKLLDIFHLGNYYYYIFHCAGVEIEFASESVKNILGISDTTDFSVDYALSIIHPDDLPYFYDFETKITQFFSDLPPDKILKYKTSYDFRVRRKDGTYIRVLQQNVTIQTNEEGAIIRTLGVHTDISKLKKTNGSTLSFIGLEGEPSFHDVHSGIAIYELEKNKFSKMEQKVLEQLLKGYTSKKIGETLFISKLTVDGHRKNMLKKAKCTSTVDLVMKAAQMNWHIPVND